jgi:hypothetical protein
MVSSNVANYDPKGNKSEKELDKHPFGDFSIIETFPLDVEGYCLPKDSLIHKATEQEYGDPTKDSYSSHPTKQLDYALSDPKQAFEIEKQPFELEKQQFDIEGKSGLFSEVSKPKRKRTQCSKCMEFGHNVRTCPVNGEAILSFTLTHIDKKFRKENRPKKERKEPHEHYPPDDITMWPPIEFRLEAERHFPVKIEGPQKKRGCGWCAHRLNKCKNTRFQCDTCQVALCAAPCFGSFHAHL